MNFVQEGKENLSKICLPPAKVRPEALISSCCDVSARPFESET